jgi:hypothetical protein
MMRSGFRAAAAVLLLLPGCAAPATFVNHVWTVAESPQVARGDTRVFLSDGTMVMTGPNSTPAFGRWQVKEGSLTFTEEGREYPVEVVELTDDVFRIRIRGPGEPVVIRFAPAGHPVVGITPPAQQ